MELYQMHAFVASAVYIRSDTTIDATKTVAVVWAGSAQTLTYNAAGQLLAATNPIKL